MTNKSRKWTRRKTARTVFAGTLLFCISYALWMSFAPPPRFPISKETTGFTEPLLPDGTVDFKAAVWKANGWPTATSKPDRWDELMATNPNDALQYREPGSWIYANKPPTTAELSTVSIRSNLRSSIPFSALDDPEFAQVIADNEPWYREVMNSEPETTPHWKNGPSKRDRVIFGRFALRATLHLGNGDTKKGIETIRFMSRLGERYKEKSSVSGILIGVSLDHRCMKLMRVALLTAEEPSELLDCTMAITGDVRLNEILATAIDETERYSDLARYCQMATLISASPIASYPLHARLETQIRDNWWRHQIDWGEFASFHKQTNDELVRRYRIEDPIRRHEELGKFRAETESQVSQPVPGRSDWGTILSGNVTADVKWSHLHSLLFRTKGLMIADISQRRLTRLTAYLAVFRNKHGRFPVSLDELQKTIPDKHSDILLNGANVGVSYERTETGFKAGSRDPAGDRPVEIEWPLPQ